MSEPEIALLKQISFTEELTSSEFMRGLIFEFAAEHYPAAFQEAGAPNHKRTVAIRKSKKNV